MARFNDMELDSENPTQALKARSLRVLVGLALICTVCVVVLGAYTRLVDAGLGCPDWPGCYGQITVPDTDEERARAEALYPNAPIEPFKAWVEMIHRYVATFLGLLAIGIVLNAWWSKTSIVTPLVLLAIVIVQGAFGAWTVTLKLWPQVVTAHLLGGFATLALIWWYFLKIGEIRIPTVSQRLRPHLHLLALCIVLQIALGGWTSSNYAALACPDFPTCNVAMETVFDFGAGFNVFQDIGPNYLGGEMSSEARVAIHMVHRWGAYVVMLVGLVLVFRLNTVPRAILATVLVVQFGLGLANIWTSLALPIAVLHNAMAAVLLLTVVTFMVGTRQDEIKTEVRS